MRKLPYNSAGGSKEWGIYFPVKQIGLERFAYLDFFSINGDGVHREVTDRTPVQG